MRKIAITLAVLGGAVSVPCSAQDVGTAFKTYGQCDSSVSRWYNDQWAAGRKIDGAKGGMPDGLDDHYRCLHVGDSWYIVPWLTGS